MGREKKAWQKRSEQKKREMIIGRVKRAWTKRIKHSMRGKKRDKHRSHVTLKNASILRDMRESKDTYINTYQ